MDKQEFLDFIEAEAQSLFETIKKKNNDYSGKNPFANFETIERLGIATTEQGFLTRMSDKFNRLVNVSKNGNEVGESFEDTLTDLAGYSLIFKAYLVHKAQKQEENPF